MINDPPYAPVSDNINEIDYGRAIKDYRHLGKLNPEIQPNLYKAGFVGVGLGLLPLVVLLLWYWWA